MKIEDLVLTIEQARRLQELGLDMNDAVFMWTRIMPEYENGNTPQSDKVWSVKRLCHTEPEYPYFEEIATYTLQEVLDKLPYDMTWDTWQWQIDHCGENMEYNDGDEYVSHRETDGSLLDKAYHMLCWAMECRCKKKE